MADWTEGYRTDIDYFPGYYGELNPLRARFALISAGIACPAFKTACELGFGQGLSVNIHAAASPITWHGNDFNALHAANAQELAAAAGAGAKLTEESFAELASRKDVPDFDYIGLHGIWSWVSDKNRHIITDFIRRKLKPGGVVYISYNTLAGCSGFEPVREMMSQYIKVIGAQGRGIIPRINNAVDFMDKIFATNPLFAKLNPVAAGTVKNMRDKNRHYLAHEYFNESWHPMHFADVVKALYPAKLEYGCSAHYMDHIDSANFTAEQLQLLQELPDTVLREGMKDLMLHQRFRRDLWVKGGRRLSAGESRQQLRRLRLVMATPRKDVPARTTLVIGEASLQEAIYAPILDLMQDMEARTVGEIEQTVAKRNLTLAQVKQAVLVLLSLGVFFPAQEAKAVLKGRKHTDALNLHLLHRARTDIDATHLACPLTGGGLPVPRTLQLFLLARHEGRKQPAEWADYAWEMLSEQGQHVIKDGKPLTSPTDNLTALKADAAVFAKGQLPVLRKLLVVD